MFDDLFILAEDVDHERRRRAGLTRYQDLANSHATALLQGLDVGHADRTYRATLKSTLPSCNEASNVE